VRFHQSLSFLPIDQVVPLTVACDGLGYAGMYLSDHLFNPKELDSRYTYSERPDGAPGWDKDTPWPDPMCVFSGLATVTTHLTFTTGVYVAPVRDLITVAKSVGTAAVLSGNRIRLGVGVVGDVAAAGGRHGVGYPGRADLPGLGPSGGNQGDLMVPTLEAVGHPCQGLPARRRGEPALHGGPTPVAPGEAVLDVQDPNPTLGGQRWMECPGSDEDHGVGIQGVDGRPGAAGRSPGRRGRPRAP